jgi:hypothetical protein
METTQQIQALRKIMSEMTVIESTTRRAKEIALEVRRLEGLVKTNDISKQETGIPQVMHK